MAANVSQQAPNFTARIPGTMFTSRLCSTSQSPTPTRPQLIREPHCRLQASAAASGDLFAIGQSLLDAGSQTLERLSRQFQPLPAGFPPGPSGDVAIRLLSNPLTFLEDVVQAHGKMVGLLLGGEHVILIADPKAAHQVLIEDNNRVGKEGTAFFPGSRLAGHGLLVSDGPLWQRQRQLSNPAFRRTAVDGYLEAMARGAQRLVDTTWRGQGRRDVYADFNDLTLQIVTDALFGFQTSTPDSKDVTAAVRIAMEFFASRAATGFAIPEWLPTPDNRQYNDAVERLDRVVYRIIGQRRAQGDAAKDSSEHRKCLLDNLLASVDESGQGMSDQALRDELMTLLIAGQETSAIVLAWTCAFLAHHPRHQDAVRQELQQVLGGAPPGPATVGKLHFLEACILESMRLLPPAYMVGRCTAQTLQIGPYTAPKGTTLLVSPYLLQRDAASWPRSREFQPQRWAPHLEGGKAGGFMALFSGLGPNGAYLPFGAGPRNCIGNYFAMTEAVLVLAHVLQAFTLEPLPGRPFPDPDAKITLRPKDVPLRLVPNQR